MFLILSNLNYGVCI